MRTHGKRYTKEYGAWNHMKGRCLNQKHKRYSDYGGRGVTVCERWLTFENFFEDMGLAPTVNHTLERIENDKGYYKENCKWATQKEQQNNRRDSVNSLIKQAAAFGMNPGTVWNRVNKLGWSLEKALKTPPQNNGLNFTKKYRAPQTHSLVQK